jgi:hypothetical protein
VVPHSALRVEHHGGVPIHLSGEGPYLAEIHDLPRNIEAESQGGALETRPGDLLHLRLHPTLRPWLLRGELRDGRWQQRALPREQLTAFAEASRVLKALHADPTGAMCDFLERDLPEADRLALVEALSATAPRRLSPALLMRLCGPQQPHRLRLRAAQLLGPAGEAPLLQLAADPRCPEAVWRELLASTPEELWSRALPPPGDISRWRLILGRSKRRSTWEAGPPNLQPDVDDLREHLRAAEQEYDEELLLLILGRGLLEEELCQVLSRRGSRQSLPVLERLLHTRGASMEARKAAADAIGRLHARLGDEAGRLSMASPDPTAGALSRPAAGTGQLSRPQGDGG